MLLINFLLQKFVKEKRNDRVTRTGGWCINDTSEKDKYKHGHHRTDVQLAAALAELLKGIYLPTYLPACLPNLPVYLPT